MLVVLMFAFTCILSFACISFTEAQTAFPSVGPTIPPFSPKNDTCVSLYPDCESCGSASTCGWCASTQQCISGNQKGPSAGLTKCPQYSFYGCPGSTGCVGYYGCSDKCCESQYAYTCCQDGQLCDSVGNCVWPSNDLPVGITVLVALLIPFCLALAVGGFCYWFQKL